MDGYLRVSKGDPRCWSRPEEGRGATVLTDSMDRNLVEATFVQWLEGQTSDWMDAMVVIPRWGFCGREARCLQVFVDDGQGLF